MKYTLANLRITNGSGVKEQCQALIKTETDADAKRIISEAVRLQGGTVDSFEYFTSHADVNLFTAPAVIGWMNQLEPGVVRLEGY